MRDVLSPLAKNRETAILPFQYRKALGATRVVLEACPGSTLKRLRIPHQNYKQPSTGPLTRTRWNTRRIIMDRLREFIEIDERLRRMMMRNPGGDAIDAVVAAVGAHQSWNTTNHAAVARHGRYPREGFIYA